MHAQKKRKNIFLYTYRDGYGRRKKNKEQEEETKRRGMPKKERELERDYVEEMVYDRVDNTDHNSENEDKDDTGNENVFRYF